MDRLTLRKKNGVAWFNRDEVTNVWLLNVAEKLASYEEAEEAGLLVRLPMTPGSIIQQDVNHENDIVFTGQVLFELICNEDHEWEDAEGVSETIRLCAESLKKEEAEAAN